MEIIGIDHGNAAMKTRSFCFPSGVVEYEHEPYTKKDVLEYNGRYYVCGTGRQPYQRDKTATARYYLLTLAAIAHLISIILQHYSSVVGSAMLFGITALELYTAFL